MDREREREIKYSDTKTGNKDVKKKRNTKIKLSKGRKIEESVHKL